MTQSLPTYFIPHGGGPCFFMEWDPPETWKKMGDWLRGMAADIGKPKAVLVISGHWEEDAFAVTAGKSPPLIFDYYGFPPETYELTYAAPGSPDLAKKVVSLLAQAGLPARLDDSRGFDHGVFIPFKLIYPDADVPVVQLSLQKDLDPAQHIAAGKALASLRDEGVLIVGSGMSYHNLPKFMRGTGTEDAQKFDTWLTTAATAPSERRDGLLAQWDAAPSARQAHPREEPLLPLMVAAGAAGNDAGKKVLADAVMGCAISAYKFG